MIRFSDIVISFVLILVLSPILLTVLCINRIYYTKPLFIQRRVGYQMKTFRLIKFRTMPIDTPNAPTHLVKAVKITYWSQFLRSSKIDELPQLFNVLIGNMSLVGPRPSLVNQVELIARRKQKNIYSIKPGISGLAQLKFITMEHPKDLVRFDYILVRNLNLGLYYTIFFRTIMFFCKKKNY